MLIPSYWAEAVIKDTLEVADRGRFRKRPATVRRFGWSNESQEAAQAHAQVRAEEAWRRRAGGEPTPWREPRAAYGAPGMPIREEIVHREGEGDAEAVITRNSYGALCLNTPRVMFADVDFEPPRKPGGGGMPFTWILLAVAVVAGVVLGSWSIGIAAVVVNFIAGTFLDLWYSRRRAARRAKARAKRLARQGEEEGGPEQEARERVDAFLATRPDWRVRLYRTPAGLRLLALHRLFDADDPEVQATFDALGGDPVYGWLCKQQHCFRARVSPKPWRVGISVGMKPRPGVWPVDPIYLAGRKQWVTKYHRASQGHAACRFLGELGEGEAHPTARAVQAIHDDWSQAETELPIA